MENLGLKKEFIGLLRKKDREIIKAISGERLRRVD